MSLVLKLQKEVPLHVWAGASQAMSIYSVFACIELWKINWLSHFGHTCGVGIPHEWLMIHTFLIPAFVVASWRLERKLPSRGLTRWMWIASLGVTIALYGGTIAL